MKAPAIKKLIQSYDLATLKLLENQISEGEPLSFEVEGEDEGEQLTHVMGAIWSLEQAAINGSDPLKEARNFFQRVRNSIS